MIFPLLTIFAASVSALQPGSVFGVKVRTPNTRFDGRSLYVYADNTLGLYDPYNDVPEFQGVLMPEYGIIFRPEPVMAVSVSDRNIVSVSGSLYNPSVGFYEDNGRLKTNQKGNRFVVCPSWNDVLLVDDGEHEVCPDAVEVSLEVELY